MSSFTVWSSFCLLTHTIKLSVGAATNQPDGIYSWPLTSISGLMTVTPSSSHCPVNSSSNLRCHSRTMAYQLCWSLFQRTSGLLPLLQASNCLSSTPHLMHPYVGIICML